MAQDPHSGIAWPDGFAPDACPVHVVNALDCVRSPEEIWRKLIRAKHWPAFYANARNVRIDGDVDDLSSGASFRWRTFGVSLRTEVVAFEPPCRITWIARTPGLVACHTWLITPLREGGCRILTEETQKGVLSRLGAFVFPGRMERWHQVWLEGLAA